MCNLPLLNSLAGVTGPAPLAASGWYFFPPDASTVADEVDYALNVNNVVTVFFFILIIGLMIFFAVRYRRRDPKQRALSQASHNTPLELAWSIPPMAIVLYIFWIGFSGFMNLTTIPGGAYEVRVNARKWAWQFTHPNGAVDANLHVPAGRPIELVLNSEDVLHSVFIPAFRVKKDVVPGRYNNLWFEALEPTEGADYEAPTGEALDEMAFDRLMSRVRGQMVSEASQEGNPAPSDREVRAEAYRRFVELDEEEKEDLAEEHLQRIAAANGHILYCAEFCGTQHSTMLAKVIVHEEGWEPSFEQFEEGEVSVDRGEQLFMTEQCIGCHQTEPGGAQLAGPTFAGGIFGQQETMADGEELTVDENYLRESILNPQAKIVEGYAPAMPRIDLEEDEVTSLILYIKSLGEE